MWKKLSIFLAFYIRLFTNIIPDGVLCERVRGTLYGLCAKKHGKNFRVASNVRFSSLNNLSVGHNVFIGCDTTILAHTDVILEDEVMLAHRVFIVAGNHTRINGSYRFGEPSCAPIMIKKGSWIGANCTILPGVTIGRGTVIGANSVVTKDVPDNCVAAGVPAKVLKYHRT